MSYPRGSIAGMADSDDLTALVGSADERLESAVKWGRLTFTLGGDWHHWLCAIAAPKSGTRLVFHKGVLLDDPAGLLAGSGRYVREIPAGIALDHPEEVRALIRSAIDHQTDL
ncbi:DUF1801 domain-containing protein [Amycolatopsis sp. 195334CR]|uniref:DUF1801 domain-containing protein n=1 Tax=Amycolatopsis sp. 195334CR TaxID=2814588 RepID=UPI001A901A4A|nr:DUF1801 domain-containing protein [Amycolatopsis sp. 195334CR]MBN6039175.1 DUF1801 domain-containing protein [Amycolatopsis sp. 195334CR]